MHHHSLILIFQEFPAQQAFDSKRKNIFFSTSLYSARHCIAALLDLALKVLALDQVGDIILVVVLLLALGLLHVLVGLGELAEGGEAVGAQLVQDTGDELGEFLLLAVAVEGVGVGGDGSVDWSMEGVVRIAVWVGSGL